jgi:hypothetical protein
VEEKQPVMSLTGDSVDFWSIPTISKVEKVGYKLLFIFIGFFLDKVGISGQEDLIRKAYFPI